jgi:hypothetical protein
MSMLHRNVAIMFSRALRARENSYQLSAVSCQLTEPGGGAAD